MAHHDIERRFAPLGELRLVEPEGDDAAPVIEGYAAVFNVLSEDLGGFREKIAPGAFANTIKTADVRALVNHDPNLLLARNKSGTLKLSEDEIGLLDTITPPDTQVGRDTVTSMRRGDLTGQSFAFRTITDSWAMEDGGEVRTLEEVELFDVSVVTYPAYPDTSVAVRSLDEWRTAHKEDEHTGSRARMGMRLRLADQD